MMGVSGQLEGGAPMVYEPPARGAGTSEARRAFDKRNDTAVGLRVTRGWTSLWMLKRVQGQWKFHAAMGPLKRHRDEQRLEEE